MAFPKRPLELYTHSVEEGLTTAEWRNLLKAEHCQYLGRRCIKTRKSQPDVTIGTCTVGYGGAPIIICPVRFLQRRQIFLDTIHLLEQHQPGNQLHVVPEVTIPGGSVDFFVVSVYRGEIRDYVAVEIQALDTTGTVWPTRQRLAADVARDPAQGISTAIAGEKSYGINWRMTAKTILVQMHHKVTSLELLGKKLVLIIQDTFRDYIMREFQTSSLHDAETADSAHFHAYSVTQTEGGTLSMDLATRQSTTTIGIEQILGMRQSASIPEAELIARLRARISDATLLQI